MKFNYSKLLGKMKECGYTQERLAKALGISPCTLNQKLKNKASFTQREIHSICVLLNICGEEVFAVFLPRMLRKAKHGYLTNLFSFFQKEKPRKKIDWIKNSK